jgi:hypothetical protein
MKALQLIDSAKRQRYETLMLRCEETGETYALREWALQIAEVTGSKSSSIVVTLSRSTMSGTGTYRGLTFTRVKS